MIIKKTDLRGFENLAGLDNGRPDMNLEIIKNSKILIVDDDPSNLGVLLDGLSNLECTVMLAQNGETALEIAYEKQPDLILLDILMPGMDGFEVCRRLKDNKGGRDAPVIIFITAVTDTSRKVMGFKLGAVDFITKPFHRDDVTARISTHLGIRKLQKDLMEKNNRLQQEIADHRQAEELLLHEKLLSEEYINSLPGLFYVFDEERFVRWNRQWEKVTGYSNKEMAAMYGTDFFEGEDRTFIAEQMMKVFSEGAAEAEAEVVTKNGRRIPYYFTGLRKEFNGKHHLVGLGLDSTERRRAMEKLEIFNRLAVSRELKMIELKKEINTLMEASGKEPRYVIAGQSENQLPSQRISS